MRLLMWYLSNSCSDGHEFLHIFTENTFQIHPFLII